MDAEAVTEVKPGDVLADKYRVDRVLGVGGMGVVVQATHTVLNERVALKFLLPAVVQKPAIATRFLREAQACVRIKSPHVARVIDVGTLESGSPYMVMEYLDGLDLAGVLERDGALDVTVACTFAMQTCEALAAAHAAEVVHRDIKPANLFITAAADGSPHLKVLDFGISKASNLGVSALTQTQVSLGSPLYMSPEQMRSARQVDPRADIWSLGVVLYEMLTDTVPFLAESMPELCALVLETHAPPVSASRPDVPPALDEVVARCLERNKDDRYADVAELADALVPFAGEAAALSAGRCRRILDGTGRNSIADFTGKHAALGNSATEIVGATATSFGATGTQKAPAPRRTRLYAAIGAVALLGLGALVFQLGREESHKGAPSPASSAPAEPSAPSVTKAATPIVAPAAPPAASESASAAPSASAPAAASAAAPTSASAKPKKPVHRVRHFVRHRAHPAVQNFFNERK